MTPNMLQHAERARGKVTQTCPSSASPKRCSISGDSAARRKADGKALLNSDAL